MKTFSWLLVMGLTICCPGVYAHETLDNGTAGKEDISITEKLGQTIPADLTFHDDAGRTVRLRDFLGKPVILTLVYYTCEHICPQLLAGLAQAAPRLSMSAGTDYRVVSVSIDPSDTPKIAAGMRRNYLQPVQEGSPANAWAFLTGDPQNIDRLTDAVGFHYRRDSHGFTHPVVLIFLSPDGKISRYFSVTKYEYGAARPITFSSFELNTALTEAAQGKPVSELKRAVLYCFSHEPPGQSKFFYFIGVIGLLTLLMMAAFFIYLQVTSKKYRKDA